MTVTATVSETLDGAQVSDSLDGGGTGVDLGAIQSNSFGPIIDKTLNQGEQSLYVHHDAVDDPITGCKTFIQTFGTGTGFTYGGAASAAADFTELTNLGNASGSSKNNADGLSGGLWIDMDWDSNDTTRFDQATFPAIVKIYGDSGTDGLSLSTAFTVNSTAMVVDSGGETAASAPVSGSIGKSGDTVLGTNAHVNLRLYIPASSTTGGVIQWEWVFVYSFTS